MFYLKILRKEESSFEKLEENIFEKINQTVYLSTFVTQIRIFKSSSIWIDSNKFLIPRNFLKKSKNERTALPLSFVPKY